MFLVIVLMMNTASLDGEAIRLLNKSEIQNFIKNQIFETFEKLSHLILQFSVHH